MKRKIYKFVALVTMVMFAVNSSEAARNRVRAHEDNNHVPVPRWVCVAASVAALTCAYYAYPQSEERPQGFVSCTDVAPWVPQGRVALVSRGMGAVCEGKWAAPRFVECSAYELNSRLSVIKNTLSKEDLKLVATMGSIANFSAKDAQKEKSDKVFEGYIRTAQKGEVLVTGGVSHCVVVAAMDKSGRSLLAHINAENIRKVDACLQNPECAKRSNYLRHFFGALDEMDSPNVTLLSGSLPQLRYMECLVKRTMPTISIKGAWNPKWVEVEVGAGAVRVSSDGVQIIEDGSKGKESLRKFLTPFAVRNQSPCGRDVACELLKD